MKWIVKISVWYFPLALVYKLFGVYEPDETSYVDEYWINSYWFVTAVYLMLIFINLIKYCKLEVVDAEVYKQVIKSVAIYWGLMAALRLFLFFNIALYEAIISGANTMTIGGVSIVVVTLYLTARVKHDRKNKK
jgi:hypothetical protein